MNDELFIIPNLWTLMDVDNYLRCILKRFLKQFSSFNTDIISSRKFVYMPPIAREYFKDDYYTHKQQGHTRNYPHLYLPVAVLSMVTAVTTMGLDSWPFSRSTTTSTNPSPSVTLYRISSNPMVATRGGGWIGLYLTSVEQLLLKTKFTKLICNILGNDDDDHRIVRLSFIFESTYTDYSAVANIILLYTLFKHMCLLGY